MESNQPLRETVLRYLSNELTESERELIDERLITDAEYEALFRETEYDLVDAYVARELNDKDRSRVESGVRTRVWHTQGLQSSQEQSSSELDREAAATAASTPVPAARTTSYWRSGPFLACAVVVAVSLTAFLHSRVHSGTAPPVQTATLTPPSAPTFPEAHSALLVLSGATRSQSSLSVSLTPDVTQLRVQWAPAIQVDPRERFHLDVVSENGVSECHADGVSHGEDGKTNVIEFQCPASGLLQGFAFFRMQKADAQADAPPVLETSVSIQR